MHQHPKRLLRRSLALVAAMATAAVPLIVAPPATAAITPTANPVALAGAIAGPGANVVGASFVPLAGAGAHGVSNGPLSGFPTNGTTNAILTTGSAAFADDPNNSPETTASLGTGPVRGNTDFDVSILKIDLNVPSTANCLSFDFKFFSEEYFEWVGTQYNDAFIAELDVSNWTTSGSTISAPNNFAFDGAGNVISVNATGIGTASLANASGTTYDGATPLLSAAKQVTPGAHSLYLSIFDQGDRFLDSATFVDNLRVGFVPDPATQCKPGAQVKQFQLNLTPSAASLETGSTHTVTATLLDANSSPPEVPGATILFETTGANNTSGSDVTDGAGQATHSYVGTAAGTDVISACHDANTNGTCDAGEVFASATADWTISTVFSINDVAVTEGQSGTTPATFTISLEKPAAVPGSVDWATVDGSATSPDDFSAASGTASFGVGDQTVDVVVEVNGDTVNEPDEQFTVVLSNPVGGTILDGTGVGTILDDDRNGAFICRAVAARTFVGGEYRVANPPGLPCADDTNAALDLTLSGLGTIAAVKATTDQTPDNLAVAPAEGDSAQAHAEAAGVDIVTANGIRLRIKALTADASATCSDGVPVLTGASSVAGLRIGNALPRPLIKSYSKIIVKDVLKIELNKKTVVGGVVRQQAIVITYLVNGRQIVISDAAAGTTGNPCTT